MTPGILQYLQSPLAPIWAVTAAFCVVIIRSGPAFMARWNEGRRDLMKAKAADWGRLRGEIARLDKRCLQIEQNEENCRRDLADAFHRIAELEGYNDGKGKARQEAANIVAVERLSDAADREAKKP